MTEKEKAFLEYWTEARKRWSWSKNFKRTVLNFVLPLVVLVDVINFFIIGDVRYGFLSIQHFWSLLRNFSVLAVIIGFAYNFMVWNANEIRYWSLMRRNRKNP